VPLVCVIITRGLAAPENSSRRATNTACRSSRRRWRLRRSSTNSPSISTTTSRRRRPSTARWSTCTDGAALHRQERDREERDRSRSRREGPPPRGGDSVVVTRKAADIIIARGHEHLQHFMEIRGIGIIDIQAKFGIRAIRVQKRLEVMVNLVEWDAKKDWEREDSRKTDRYTWRQDPSSRRAAFPRQEHHGDLGSHRDESHVQGLRIQTRRSFQPAPHRPDGERSPDAPLLEVRHGIGRGGGDGPHHGQASHDSVHHRNPRRLAQELVETARRIFGDFDSCAAVTNEGKVPNALYEEVRQLVDARKGEPCVVSSTLRGSCCTCA